jgi:hypothetical protein
MFNPPPRNFRTLLTVTTKVAMPTLTAGSVAIPISPRMTVAAAHINLTTLVKN